MKVVIFGASGGTGRELVRQALDAGHDVTAFVRDVTRLGVTHERLRVAQGDVRHAAAVSATTAGQDAVLSALGPSKPDFDAMTVGARNILAAMNEHGVRRLVTLTGAGVPDSNARPKLFNHVISFLLKRISPGVLEDATRHVELVRGHCHGNSLARRQGRAVGLLDAPAVVAL